MEEDDDREADAHRINGQMASASPNLEPLYGELNDLKDRVNAQEESLVHMRKFVLQSTSKLAMKKASTKAYEQELQKHFWVSSFVSFLLGVSIGVISMNIFTSK